MFDKVFCALLILFSLNSFSSSFEIQPRILNGTVSERGQFPFFVLYYGYPRDAPEVGIPCGGVLLNEKFVLTVAHCVENVIKVDVHLGSLRQFEHEEDRQVFSSLPEHLHIHPEYELKTLFNDIALIELPQPAVYTDQIRPVKFPNVCEVSTGIDLIAIGNGYDKTDGQPSEILKYTTMKTVTYDECRDNFLILDNKSSFCARSDNSAVCQGIDRFLINSSQSLN